MAPRPKWTPRRTVFDMYTERDQTRWYWRVLGTLASSLILLGFLIFPYAFPSTANVGTSQSTFTSISAIFLALGYSLSVALYFVCPSWLFQFDVIFVPCLLASLLGLLSTALALTLHPTPTPWPSSTIAALALALCSTTLYSASTLVTYLRIARVRSTDPLHRRRGSSETRTLLPPDELQRQQLLRLLNQKEPRDPSPAASQSTFRIDMPSSNREAASTYLTAPSHTHASVTRSRSLSNGRDDNAFALAALDGIPEHSLKREALHRARERSAQRERSEVDLRPPVIVNTRTVEDAGAEIPLSERHPLERDGGFVRGRGSKDGVPKDGVWRPEDEEEGAYEEEDAGYPAGRFENGYAGYEVVDLEPPRVEAELEEQMGVRGELEAEVVPRIVRVQTDGWPGS